MFKPIRLEIDFIFHLAIIYLNELLFIIKTEINIKWIRKKDIIDSIIMKEKILFFILLELNSELSIGRIFRHVYYLTHNEFL